MLTAHKIALAPNNRQATLLARHAGYARVAANWSVSAFQEGLDRGVWLSEMDLRRMFNRVKRDLYPWSGCLSQMATKNAIKHVGRAIQA